MRPLKCIKNIVTKKAIEIKKNKCSAPFTLTVFILICMMIIFSLETIGILRKEKNLDYRIPTAEITIIQFDLDNLKDDEISLKKEFQDGVVLPPSETSESTYTIQSIILEAALRQLEKENIVFENEELNFYNHNSEIINMGLERNTNDEDEIDLFDN